MRTIGPIFHNCTFLGEMTHVLFVLRECEAEMVTEMLVWCPGRCVCGECIYGWYTWFMCFV